MWNALMWAQKNLVWSIPAAMLAGLGFGIAVADPAFLRAASAYQPLAVIWSAWKSKNST